MAAATTRMEDDGDVPMSLDPADNIPERKVSFAPSSSSSSSSSSQAAAATAAPNPGQAAAAAGAGLGGAGKKPEVVGKTAINPLVHTREKPIKLLSKDGKVVEEGLNAFNTSICELVKTSLDTDPDPTDGIIPIPGVWWYFLSIVAISVCRGDAQSAVGGKELWGLASVMFSLLLGSKFHACA
jgi:hypothetical protein